MTITNSIINKNHSEFRYSKYITPITFGVIFLCHFLVFLAFYPGLCIYDLDTQIAQWNSKIFCANHPLLHTLFIGFCYDMFENRNNGYAIATLIQLIIVDGSMCYGSWYLGKRISKKWMYIILTGFYAIFPVNSLLAISHTKDILFAALGLIFIVDCKRILYGEDLKIVGIIRIVINTTLLLLMRNNAIYAMALTVVFMLIVIIIQKISKKIIDKVVIKIMLICILAIFFAFLGNKLLMKATNATTGSIKEMMSIPAQIMGRIYNTSATDEEKELILEYIPAAEEYRYYLSDIMKRDLPFEIWESKCKHFLLDTAIIAIKHPWESIKAVWFSVQGYFDILHCPYSSDFFFLAKNKYMADAVLDTKLPGILNIYTKLFNKTDIYGYNPVIIFLNIAIYVWAIIIAFAMGFIRRRWRESLLYIFLIALLLTLLAGPGAIIRYAYIYIISAPIAIYDIINRPVDGLSRR